MRTLCETFRYQAFWTWQQLCLAHENEVHIGEESFTDFNLLEIRSRHTDQVITKTFTKFQEAEVGADWEWWLTGKSRKWIGFRLQAKVINHKSARFEHLNYSNEPVRKQDDYFDYLEDSPRSQADKLCRHALKNRCIPLYCLYTYSPEALPNSRHAPEAYGCSLVDAHFVRQHQKDPEFRRLRNLFHQMLPWHCLVCHSRDDQDLPHRAHEVWRTSILQPHTALDFQSAPAESPPHYVQLLMQGDLQHGPDECLRTITVFSDTNEIGWT